MGVFGKFLVQQLAEFLDRDVHEKADVADAEAGGRGDVLVRAVVDVFEAEHLALIRGELLDKMPHAIAELVGVARLRGVRPPVAEIGDGVLVAEVEPLFLAQDIEGAIAADRVEPCLDVLPHLVGLGQPELEKGVLYDITRPVNVTIEDAGCVGDEAAFI